MGSLVQSMLRRLLPRLTPSQAQACVRVLYWLPGFTQRVSVCPVCGAKPDRVEFTTPFSPLDHCAACGHVFSRMMPGKLILSLMYRDLDYWKQDKEHQGIAKIDSGPHWKGFIDARMGAMQNNGVLAGSSKKIFEIGCSEGILLRELENLGHEALGSECNLPVAEEGMKALGVKIRIGLFEDIALPRSYYDVVASFHTIEHITDLGRTFTKIVDILKPDGLVFVEVPVGADDYANRDHVQFFSDESLKRLLQRYFEVGETVSNRFLNAEGAWLGSLYGVGRRPRKNEP